MKKTFILVAILVCATIYNSVLNFSILYSMSHPIGGVEIINDDVFYSYAINLGVAQKYELSKNIMIITGLALIIIFIIGYIKIIKRNFKKLYKWMQ